MKTDRWITAIGATVAVFGTAILLARAAPTALANVIAANPPTAATGLCFFLSGVALLLPLSSFRFWRIGYQSIGVALLLISWIASARYWPNRINIPLLSAVLTEAGFENFSFSLSPSAALAFTLAWLALIGVSHSRSKFWTGVIVVALFGILMLGAAYIVINLFDVGILFSRYDQNGMMVVTAIGLLVLDAGLFAVAYSAGHFTSLVAIPPDKKITFIGGAIVLLFGLVVGLAVSGLWVRTTIGIIEDSLRISLNNRVQTYQAAIDAAMTKTNLISRQTRFHRLMAELAKQPDNQLVREELNRILDHTLVGTGITGIAIYDVAGHLIGERGSIPANSRLQAALQFSSNAVLLWDNRSILKVSVPVFQGMKHLGNIVVAGPLPTIDRLMVDVTGLGRTGTMAVCSVNGKNWVCFPNRINSFQGKILTPRMQTFARAMAYALHGKKGVIYSTDPQNRRVLAAYGPIGPLGLGMVVRVRTTELFQPVRARFFEILIPLTILEVIGLMLLRWQIAPLAAKLVHEIQERKAAEERLSYLAHHDTLTGLPNRALLHDRLQQAIVDAGRHGWVVAVMYLDLDNFKDINDTLGHEAGDMLLKEVAMRLTSCVRSGDTVSHLGGDEFCCILAGVAHSGDVNKVAEKILEGFSGPCMIGDRELFINVSVGITLYPLDARTPQDLLKNADIAMYRAKKHGGGNYQYYSADLAVVAAERLALQTALRHAIVNGELQLHYQPQVDLRNGRMIAVEALLRWHHPDRGWIPPAQFVPLAEDCGLILPIGEWVLNEACRQTRQWHDAGHRGLRLAVNLSGRQFRQERFAAKLASILSDTGLSPQLFEIELTESLLMSDIDGMTGTLEQLHDLGITISIDDFGTGYSSLSYLKRFPISILKIDRSFVEHITVDSDDAAIVTTIVNMARGLGMKVVAEGVETREQLAFLRSLDCDVMQGNYFSPSLSAADLSQLLQEARRLTA